MHQIRVNAILILIYHHLSSDQIRTLLRKASNYNPDEIFGVYALGYCKRIGEVH